MSSTKAPSMQEKVADLVGHVNATMEKVAAEKAAADKVAAQVDALIPSVVDELLAHGRIEPHQKQAALAALKDPVKTLEILRKTAGHRNDAEAQALGQPVPATTKVAGAAGAPTSGESTLRPSDQKLWTGLGLRVPLS